MKLHAKSSRSRVLAQLNLFGQPRSSVHQAVHNAGHSEDTPDDGACRCDKVVPAPKLLHEPEYDPVVLHEVKTY